ncbi:MAG: calcium/sodium antiporter [Actinomycetota bacterium]
MILGLVFLVIGIGLLTVAADRFVDGSAAVARHFGISPVVVGALIIGFGTSLPEMLVSGLAAGRGDADLGVGNVVGSNVANLTLVLGFAALITTISASRSVTRQELPLCVASVLLFALFVQNGFTRWEGAVLAFALALTLGRMLMGSGVDLDALDDDDDDDDAPLSQTVVTTIVGLIGTVGGAYLLVEGALDVADELGLTGGFVGLTMVAIGTSLPEMVTAFVAARKGETDLIIGNLLGSNIFNSLAVGAVLGLVGPGPIEDTNLTGLATIVMIVVVLLAAAFLLFGGKVVRWQAIVLLAVYVATMPFTISIETDCDDPANADDAACVTEGESAQAAP